jgi:ATP-binding cassette subfamily B protein
VALHPGGQRAGHPLRPPLRAGDGGPGDGQAAEGEDPTRCPSCHAPLPPDSDECPICTRELNTPPSTWVLLRLWRFARPYQGKLLAGFLLMLASTGATLVPPYLTIPLMDEVLIPFQNGSRSSRTT